MEITNDDDNYSINSTSSSNSVHISIEIEDKKSLFKYFSTLYTNQCLSNYLTTKSQYKISIQPLLSSTPSIKNKSKTKYQNNPLVYYQGIYLFLSRRIKKLYVFDKKQETNYFLIEDIFKSSGQINVKKNKEEKEKEKNENNFNDESNSSLSPSLIVCIFRPFILHLFNIKCLCLHCSPDNGNIEFDNSNGKKGKKKRNNYFFNDDSNNSLSPSHNKPSSKIQNLLTSSKNHICVYQVLKKLLTPSYSNSLSSSTLPYSVMEKYNNKIESLYIQGEGSSLTNSNSNDSISNIPSSPPSTPKKRKYHSIYQENFGEKFFNHPGIYDYDIKEEDLIKRRIPFFKKYETIILNRLFLLEKSGYITPSEINNHSTLDNTVEINKFVSNISTIKTGTTTTASTSSTITIEYSHENRFICRIPKYKNKKLSILIKNEDISFEKLLEKFKKNRSDYCCTCNEYLYNCGHYLCRHIIASQLQNIYEIQTTIVSESSFSNSNSRTTESLSSVSLQKYSNKSKNKKINLLEIKRKKYSESPYLKKLELQLLNIIKK